MYSPDAAMDSSSKGDPSSCMRMISGGHDRVARLWSMEEGKASLLCELKGHVDAIFSVSFRCRICRRQHDTGGIMGICLVIFEVPTHNVIFFLVWVCSQDGSLAATGGWSSVCLWGARSGSGSGSDWENLSSVSMPWASGGPTLSLAFHPSGAALYTGGLDGRIRW